LDYTLSDDQGKLIETSKGKEPLTHTHGQGDMIPGLKKQLLGMKVGQRKNVRLKAQDAYGSADPKVFIEAPRGNVPADGLKVGNLLMGRTLQGEAYTVRVHEIKEKAIVLDMNHPLTGKTLVFDITIRVIKAAVQ
jgi:FKBP-type peptidyl-prolyl cis-trans isomerase 2